MGDYIGENYRGCYGGCRSMLIFGQLVVHSNVQTMTPFAERHALHVSATPTAGSESPKLSEAASSWCVRNSA